MARLQLRLEELGLRPRRAGANLVFEVGTGAPRVLLVSHVDTVPAADDWVADPFAGRWEGGRLVGLGANDAKGCVAALVGAALSLRRGASRSRSQPGTAVFAFTVEEETGGVAGISALLPEIGPLDAAVVGEPTGLLPCAAQRGMLILRCEAHGVAAHVAHGGARDNAVHRAARDITRLEALRWPAHPLLGATQAQVTLVEGGRARNQVPARCTFWVDLRTTPDLLPAALLSQIQAALESRVQVYSDRYAARATDVAEPIVRAALVATGASETIGSATTSDWAFLPPSLPAVKLGPGESQRSHTAQEYLLASELQRGVQVYHDTITNYFEEQRRDHDAPMGPRPAAR